MTSVVSFVVDTNLFHECLSLDASDFPWSDLGNFDTIELLVSGPVQSELDRQKKDTRPRVKRRAVKAVTWFREMLQSGTREHVFREQGPRVLMRVTSQTPSPNYPGQLDLAVDDDKIVGVAAALVNAAPDRDIRVLSHDTRPIAKADALGLQFAFIPDSWLRKPEIDGQEKEIAQLKAKIAELQATHPALAVELIGAAVDQRLSLTRNAWAALSEDEIASVRTKVTDRFSASVIEQAFGIIDPGEHPQLLVALRTIAYVPPSADELTRYREKIHPAWIEDCVSHLASLPSIMSRWISPPAITITLKNTGFRPGENVRIHFVARGPFLIAPPRDEEYVAELADLPEVPRPPTGHYLRNGTDSAVGRIMDLADMFPDISRSRIAPPRRNDEAWYYDPNRPDTPVASFDFQCRRFRHDSGGLESFNLLIFPQDQEAVTRGAIEVEVSASNVGRPLTVTFPVEVTTKFVSPMQAIESFLAGQDPIQAARRNRS